MSKQSDAIAQALAAQAVPPQSAPAAQNPFVLNQMLEQAAAQEQPPMHPMIQAIMQRMGLLNMVRNRSNQQMVDPETLVQ